MLEFDECEGIDLAVFGERAIVVVGDDPAAGVALETGAAVVAAERLGRVAVGVEHVGIVLVDGVHDAQRPAFGIPFGVGLVVLENALLAEGDLGDGLAGALGVFAEIDVVEQARIEPLPPFALAVGEREVAVVGHAGFGAGLVRPVGVGHHHQLYSWWKVMPNFMPSLRASLDQPPIMSFFGPMLTEFHGCR